jgi:hypothetical protein
MLCLRLLICCASNLISSHAWGREKGFHTVLANSVCERRGEVERKRRSDAGKVMTPEERLAFREKLKRSRVTQPPPPLAATVAGDDTVTQHGANPAGDAVGMQQDAPVFVGTSHGSSLNDSSVEVSGSDNADDDAMAV